MARASALECLELGFARHLTADFFGDRRCDPIALLGRELAPIELSNHVVPEPPQVAAISSHTAEIGQVALARLAIDTDGLDEEQSGLAVLVPGHARVILLPSNKHGSWISVVHQKCAAATRQRSVSKRWARAAI